VGNFAFMQKRVTMGINFSASIADNSRFIRTCELDSKGAETNVPQDRARNAFKLESSIFVHDSSVF
jgi:hypothetical protein